MAVTQTERFALPQWGSGADTPSRTAFNDAFGKIDAQAAKDLGEASVSSLPTAGLADGTYVQTVDGPYRRLFRRAAGAWQQVGGSTWSEITYYRADSALPTAGVARQTSHPGLPNPTATEHWDGSTVRGARQAIGDLNPNLPGALHVGDTDTGVDLSTRGRIYARTRAAGERGIVASAHANAAGPLFAARESGGTDPWLVDAQGRMRAQAPSAFGAAALSDAAALSSAPAAVHASAADLYAAPSKDAVRFLRAVGDTDPIAAVAQNRIGLGRGNWPGGRIDLIAPTIAAYGPLSVSGHTALAGLSARAAEVTSLDSSGTVSASRLTASGGVQAESGRIYSQQSGAGALLFSRPPTQYRGTSPASLRQAITFQAARNPNTGFGTGERYLDVDVVMAEDGWLRLDSVVGLRADLGASNSYETTKAYWWFDLRTTDGSLIETSYQHTGTVTTDASARKISGHSDFGHCDIFWTRVSAGTYTIRIRYKTATVLWGYLAHLRYTVTPVVLHSIDA